MFAAVGTSGYAFSRPNRSVKRRLRAAWAGVKQPWTTGSPWFLNIKNTHIRSVLIYVAENQGATILETKDALHTSRGNVEHLETRREIASAFEILVFLGMFEKYGHRFFTSKKADLILVVPENRVKLNSAGLPIATNFKSRFAFEDTHIPIGPRITRDAE